MNEVEMAMALVWKRGVIIAECFRKGATEGACHRASYRYEH